MKCYDDIHKNLHDDVMSFNDADALQGIGERMMKDQNAVKSRFCCSNGECRSQLGRKASPS